MELHQLRYFVAVARLKNFTRAAEQCHVAQPSLSQQIIKLEKELGQPLLERLGRGVRLTEAGELLYERAVSILADIDAVTRQITESPESGTGRISVGAIPTVAPYLLPGIVERFVSAFPKAELTVLENRTEHTVRSCLDRQLDLGILALPLDEPRLQVEPLFAEELLVALAPNHPLATKDQITMQDIHEEAFILLDETHCLGEQIVQFCRDQKCAPAISCQGTQLSTVQEFVAMGHGVSLIPRMACRRDVSGRCVYRSLAGTQPRRELAMIWHRQAYQSPLVRELQRIVREVCLDEGA